MIYFKTLKFSQSFLLLSLRGQMKKLDECKYVTSIDQCTPDANNYIRLTTEYLSEINLDTIQTTDGVIHLLE
jgi:hypothetical protein